MSNKRKNDMKSKWKNQLKINFTDEEFEFIWGVYQNIEECMKCSKHFKDRFDKCLDHNHDTGEIRYILCRCCNSNTDVRNNIERNKLGETNITIEVNQGIFYRFEKKINKHKIVKRFSTNKYTLEEVIEIKNKLIKNIF